MDMYISRLAEVEEISMESLKLVAVFILSLFVAVGGSIAFAASTSSQGLSVQRSAPVPILMATEPALASTVTPGPARTPLRLRG